MRTGILFLLLICLQTDFAKAQKRPIDHPDFDTWNRIQGRQISNDGQWVAYHLKPGKGDQTLKIANHKGKEMAAFERGVNSVISWEAQCVAFMLKPAMDSVNALRRKKTKKTDLPKDTLAIYNLQKNSLHKIPNVQRFSLPKKWDGFLTYTLDVAPPPEKKEVETDSTSTKKDKPKKEKKVSKENGYHVVVLNLKTLEEDTLKYVLHYSIADEGKSLIYQTTGVDSIHSEGIYYYNIIQKTTQTLCQGKGKFYQLTIDKAGKQVAFISDFSPKSDQIRNYQLRYWKVGMDTALVKVENGHAFLTKDWLISQHGNLSFSDNSSRLFFGTTPPPILQDTSLLPEEIVSVEIWNYQNGRLHTQQNVELERDKKKSYLAVWDILTDKIHALATPDIPMVRTTDKGNGDWALGLSYLPYEKLISWEGYPRRQDIYLINVKTGAQKLVIQNIKGSASISAKGKYLYWYNAIDSVWFSYDNAGNHIHALTRSIPTSMADEKNDVPNLPYQYGIAGWTADDAQVLIYDRFDLWQVDPLNRKAPINLTNGRKEKLQYRYIDLDREEPSLDANMLLSIFNETTKASGFASLKLGTAPKQLIYGDFKFTSPLKARNSSDLLYFKESHLVFPNILKTDLSFGKSLQISDANPQQKDYNWSTVELCHWTSLDGKKLTGLLYKPENFDPTKKYPMMVYFYERYSDQLHDNKGVVPHRSIINPVFYASRGYLIFIPDIVYRTGYPGESCYNSVIPGVTSLIEQGFVDKDNIGVQGHSWGGYQIAYLVTKTNIFKAAEAGAPVSNMTSAYGGIRWGSGLSRMFQYEHTQSRIGGTLWEYPMRFIENSPIFYVDKIETPLLILHNDKDGHVPWYQGIELYVAMRRLGKPSWMLNYNGEPHWPTSWQNIRDLTIRMQQYFDYYLKDAPMPAWMGDGVPAIEKGINTGFELEQSSNQK